MLRKKLDVAVSFGSMASSARAAPMEDIPRKVRPNIPGGNKAAGSSAARMGQVVMWRCWKMRWRSGCGTSSRKTPVEMSL